MERNTVFVEALAKSAEIMELGTALRSQDLVDPQG